MATPVRRETTTFSGDGPAKGVGKSDGNGRPPVLIVYAGPNGSGETTMANVMLQHGWPDGCEHINPDNIARDRFGDWNDSGAVLQAVRYAAGSNGWARRTDPEDRRQEPQDYRKPQAGAVAGESGLRLRQLRRRGGA